jgi:Cys-rich repeat protein
MRLKTLVLIAVVADLGCGGVSLKQDKDGGAGATGTAGSTGTGGAGGGPPHRPVASACTESAGAAAPRPPPPARRPVQACIAHGDCRPDGGSGFDRYCHGHVCTPDQCFADSDCATGQVCACKYGLGHGLGANVCLTSGCRIDADCASGLCSPAVHESCPTFVGYHCRTPADTCRVDADCPNKSDGGITVPYNCQYAPELGHWRCSPVSMCVG